MKEIIVDSFAGGGGASTGIEMALGVSPDIAINHDAVALNMHAANHPATRHLPHSIWKVDPLQVCEGRPVGLLWASPDCFPAGTLVLTAEGYRPIEEIEVGDLVLTHQCRWRAVTETSRTVRPLVSIRGHGHPGLVVSPEHPFLARKRDDVWQTSPRGYKRTLLPRDWVPASILDRGWYWASPVSFPSAEIPPVGGRGIAIDENFMWLVGRYLGDGWTRLTDTRAEVVITCGMHEVSKLRERLAVWPRAGSRSVENELAWSERETGTAYQFAANHRGLIEWLRKHFGHRAESKGLPAWMYGISAPLRRALVEGYVSADGWKSADICETRTVSKALAFGMKSLLNSIGKTVTVHLLSNSGEIQGRIVNARPIYMLRWRLDPNPAHVQTFREDSLEWCPIREQVELPEMADVYNIGVEEDESYVVEGIIVHNCKHFSKAKGGKPVERSIRDLAWVVVRWAKQVSPRVIILENVEEFQTWGPLAVDGRPCPDRKGATFRKWVSELKRLGYKVEFKELRACDYGAPTIRKRLFLIARRDGAPIVWPKPTHGDPKSEAVKSGKLLPWRTAAEIIDWSLPCPSIFDTSAEIMTKYGLRAVRPLQEATMARIAKGVKRYVLDAAKPFIVNLTHHGAERTESIDDPMMTVTGAHRGEKALAVPFVTGVGGRMGQTEPRGADQPAQTLTSKADSVVVTPFVSAAQQGGSVRPVDDPLHTVTASRKDQNQIIVPTLIQTGYGERAGQEPRVPGLDKPLGTAVAGGIKHAVVAPHLMTMRNAQKPFQGAGEPAHTVTAGGAHMHLVAAFLAQHNLGVIGHSAEEPVSTVTQTGSHQNLVAANLLRQFGTGIGSSLDEPARTVMADGAGKTQLSAAFLQKYYGVDQDPRLEEPLHTATTKDRFGVVTVNIDGEPYVITDIGMRMLSPRELFRAQGFSDSYIIDRGADGKPITKTDQVSKCGNSVCPPMARALVAANFAPRDIETQDDEEFVLQAAE